MTLSIRPIDDGPMGAVVTGWRPEADLGDDELAAVRIALRERLVLVFRGQPEIADLDLIRFAARFGDLLKGSEFLRDAGDVSHETRQHETQYRACPVTTAPASQPASE